ncbi:SDR family oxidoreductase [Ponticaulis profundi]|uniref:SDR family oxidoreductase n=1 Tax=Ponticaulis profundi TaxID=2665222 RepID=A0ABW1S9Y8_9PROT
MTKQVLVTGATGFIAMQTILDLLEGDYRVRGTVRSLNKADTLREALRPHTPMADMLELVEADLSSDKGWDQAVEGCDAVLHLASPFPAAQPKNPDELIKPARDGALRVLRAAKAAGVKRVVMTSSMAAIAYGWGDSRPDLLTEAHWSNPDNLKDNTAYTRSKTIAERAAWDFVNSPEGEGLELATINPAAVLGPALCAEVSTSLEIVSRLIAVKMPALPNVSFGIIDVRDVSQAHIQAMETPEAAGQRFILTDRTLWFTDIADTLRTAFPDRAEKIPTRKIPNWVLKLMAVFDPALKQIVPELGRFRNASNTQLKTVLGITPRPAEEAIIASATSLLEHKVVS